MKTINEWRDAIAKVALYLGGIAGIVYGFWLIYHPAGFIVGGILCVALSLVLDKSADSK